ncbi:AMP-binding protein [Nocardia sp. CA2R105]|uniref:AMP-binding protein n=1 Tax=Nocardia coffeae TaxID=2873381 RepID=UPI001CA71E13|nr:AMP-binding protein [Nocardia coffeae]MBY8862939.1 AMP-binding protein [Nocardia coffeae]
MATDPIGYRDQWSHIPDDLRIRYDRDLVSIPNAVRAAAERFGSLEALVDGDVRMTFAQLETAMIDSVRAVIALGVEPGDRVAIWAPNSFHWIVAALGIQGAGGVLVPINTRFKGGEAAFVLRKSDARALVTMTDFLGNDYPEMLRAVDPSVSALDRVVVASGEVGPGQLSWDRFLARGREAVTVAQANAAIDAVRSDDLSDIMFTSGTTGQPKGVMLSHGQSLRAHGWLAKVMDFRAGDRYLIIPPFFHTFGYKAGWMACIVHGVCSIPQRVFDIDAVLRTVADERVSILLGPPTMYQDILDRGSRGEDVSSLRVTMPSAAMVPPDLFRRIATELGAEIVHSGYGLTEATSLVTATVPRVDDVEDIASTVGRAAWDVELRVVDDEGHDVPTGEAGELLVRGYNVMRGYWEDPEQTAEVIDADGWLRTGDVVAMDERGYIRIMDRKKDVVVVGGFNVYPAEVERMLGEHPSVAEIAVVGVSDARMGEVPVAFVVPRPLAALTEAEFRAWAAEKIANFKVPRRVMLVDALPRNASMKVLKNALRDLTDTE